MFCYQCQETSKGIGCTSKGVCGKDAGLASLMDLLLYVTKGICAVKVSFPADDMVLDNGYIYSSLFKTITNADYSHDDIKQTIAEGLEVKKRLITKAKEKAVPLPDVDAITWHGSVFDYEKKAKEVGVLAERNVDVRSAKELIIYGIKGIAAYMYHAEKLGYTNRSIDRFVDETLAILLTDILSFSDSPKMLFSLT